VHLLLNNNNKNITIEAISHHTNIIKQLQGQIKFIQLTNTIKTTSDYSRVIKHYFQELVLSEGYREISLSYIENYSYYYTGGWGS